jgi:hypothetical protein
MAHIKNSYKTIVIENNYLVNNLIVWLVIRKCFCVRKQKHLSNEAKLKFAL